MERSETLFNEVLGRKDYTKEKYEKEYKKDCKKYKNMIVDFPAVKRIIAIGDIHGDIKDLIDRLKLAEVITRKGDNKYHWSGGDTYVVQLGDQIDRRRVNSSTNVPKQSVFFKDEGHDLVVLRFMTRLDEEAMKQGGRVISLLGNHELLNLLGLHYMVSNGGFLEALYDSPIDKTTGEPFIQLTQEEKEKVYNEGYKSMVESYIFEKRERFVDAGRKAREQIFNDEEFREFIACSRASAVSIGSNLFVHASIEDDTDLDSMSNLYKVNTLIRKWILDKFPEEYETEDDKLSEMLTYGKKLGSLFWSRNLGNDVDKNNFDQIITTCDELETNLQLIGMKHMIVGHMVQFNNKIQIRCGNKIHMVDIGRSDAFQNFWKVKPDISVLEIKNDNEFDILTAKSDNIELDEDEIGY